ncbi:hypothetical protein VTI74DRAFT_6721 [Chaetomium olivicolor]
MTDRLFSLQPRPAPRRDPQSIGEFIQRVNAEGGDGFRGLRLADLRRELAAQQNAGRDPDSDHDVDMTGDASEADSEAVEMKDVATARDDILRAIHQTHQTAMFALDSVSLLLSKENPAQAVTTFSPGLRDMVGIGTLGATVLETPTTLAQSRVPDQRMVSIGKRLMDLNKAADTALAASKRLQREIGFETRYWSEALAVSDAGWQAFRMPNEPQTMGVKFGFSNAAPEFKANSIAPMRRAADGSVNLEHGRLAKGSKRLQVSVIDNGVAVGRSSLPPPLPADAPLQDRVRESRDTIFAQELWQEINREANTLLEYGVRAETSAVSFALGASRFISLQLVDLDDEDSTGTDHSDGQDGLANFLCTAFSLLLSSAHRANEQKRSAPSIATKGAAPPYSILTPIISYYQYNKAVQQSAQSLQALLAVLRGAGLPATITVTEGPIPSFSGPASPSISLTTTLLRPPAVHFDITITPDSASRLRVLVKPVPRAGAAYSVTCLPSPDPSQNVQNPLATLNPPEPTDYTNLDLVLHYIYDCVPIALAVAQLRSVSGDSDIPKDNNNNNQNRWTMHATNKGVVDFKTGEYGLHFCFGPNPHTKQLELTLAGDFIEGRQQQQQQEKEAKAEEEGAMDVDGQEDVNVQEDEGERKAHREWTWPGCGAGGPVDAVAKHVLMNGPVL